MSTGVTIKKLREKAGLSRAELAEKMGVSKSLVNNYENDSYKASENFMRKLADVLDVSQEALLAGSADEKPKARQAEKTSKKSTSLFSTSHFQDKLKHIGYQLNASADNKYIISNDEKEFCLTYDEIADLNDKCDTYLKFLLSDL